MFSARGFSVAQARNNETRAGDNKTRPCRWIRIEASPGRRYNHQRFQCTAREPGPRPFAAIGLPILSGRPTALLHAECKCDAPTPEVFGAPSSFFCRSTSPKKQTRAGEKRRRLAPSLLVQLPPEQLDRPYSKFGPASSSHSEITYCDFMS